jgi:hypothetical protein
MDAKGWLGFIVPELFDEIDEKIRTLRHLGVEITV